MKTLQRQAVTINDELDPVLTEAATELGYAGAPRSPRLERTLARLDIRPFNCSSVDAYKQSKLSSRFGDVPVYVMVLAMLAATLGASALFVCCIVASGPQRSEITYADVIPIFVISTVLWLAVLAGSIEASGRRTATWNSVPIRQYKRPVPEFALATALAVSRDCKDVQIFVEEIQYSTNKDPFLVVELDEVRYYLEVWNEPGFGKKREV